MADLKKILVAGEMTTKEPKETALDDAGMSETVFYELLKELKETPGVTFTPKGKKWSYIVPQGEPKLS